MGAKTVVFTCPSCFHTWKHLYDTDVKLMHASQLIAELIKDGRIKLKKDINVVATYHDPCDLGRNTGIYEEPREVIQAIPGLTFRGAAHEPEIFRLLRGRRQCGDDRSGLIRPGCPDEA